VNKRGKALVGRIAWRSWMWGLRISPGRTLAHRALAGQRVLLPLATLVLVLGVLLFLWKVPQWQLTQWRASLEPKDLAQLENAFRVTWAQIVGGMVLVIGLYFTWRNLIVAREGQITERFTRAIDQIDSKKSLEVRLGGIYALERIARDSSQDHGPVMEVLTAYIRTHATWDSQKPAPEGRPAPTADIQTVLTVLGRRTRTFGMGEQESHNLSGTDLRGAILRNARLQGAFLIDAHLEWADLRGARLEGADLRGAHLEQAFLKDTHLERASLTYAYLVGASLVDAHLVGADFRGAHLERANLRGAHLEGANLKGASLEGASLAGAHLEGADLEGTDLRGAHLEGAHLEDANLAGVNLAKTIGLVPEQLAVTRRTTPGQAVAHEL
jgi:uncharacterized protein YjbI with pentapeptide repeats